MLWLGRLSINGAVRNHRAGAQYPAAGHSSPGRRLQHRELPEPQLRCPGAKLAAMLTIHLYNIDSL